MKKFGFILTIIGLLACTIPVQAQLEPFQSAALTPSDTSIAAGATEASTTAAVEVVAGQGVGFFITFKLGGAGTDNCVFKFDVSYDGTTWTTTKPFTTGNVAANGTTSVIHYVEFGPGTTAPLGHVRYIRLAQVVNGSSGEILTLEGVRYTRSNR
jgi:hypothetical protein